MRIHIYGSNGVPTIPRLTVCAFNQTAIKYAKALKQRGHHIIFYGTKEFESQFDSICSQFVPNASIETFEPLISKQRCQEQFGSNENLLREWKEFEDLMWHPNIDSLSPEEFEKHLIFAFSNGIYLSNSMSGECMKVVRKVREHVRLGMEIAMDHIEAGDIVLTFYDTLAYELYQKFEQRGAIVINALVQCGDVENFLNRTIFSSKYLLKGRHKHFETVRTHEYAIPPFFKPEEFIFNSGPRNSSGPFLYLARIEHAKGASFFLDLVRALPDLTFWMAGPAKFENNELYVHGVWGPPGYKIYNLTDYPNLKYWGVADKELRAYLLSNATALIQPSLYGEPFGWNVVEANLCGTPAIAPDRGAFPETIEMEVTGFRYPKCDWPQDAYPVEKWRELLQSCASLSPEVIRERAIRLYSEDTIIPKYIETLERIKADPGNLLITD